MPQLPDTDLVPESRNATRGTLDRFSILNDEVGQIEGWILPFDAGTPSGLDVKVGTETLPTLETAFGLDSPDIARAFPFLTGVEKTRFAARVRLTEETRPRLDRGLISITPTYEKTSGATFYGAMDVESRFADEARIRIIGGDPASAFEFLGYFIELGGLLPEHHVLDVGCGCGRMAVALTYWLRPPGTYDGFDIAADGIQWAQKEITPHDPHFRFQAVDIHNQAYNPKGKLSSSEFSFPYEAATFDFAFLTSVFTHMVGEEVRHYLAELGRTMKPGGTVACTCFLVNDETKRLEATTTPPEAALKHEVGEFFTSDPELPEKAIGFTAERLFGWIQDAGFSLTARYPGAWCGRSSFTSYQDLLILTRKA